MNKMIKKKKRRNSTWQFWAIILIPLVLVFVFNYIPMFGVIIAFEDFSPRKGILGSDWVGLKYVIQFLTSQSSTKVIKNTFILGIYQLIFTFPVPIILAVSLNECRSRHIKKFVQLITYAPYFISTVVLVGILMQVTDMELVLSTVSLEFLILDLLISLGIKICFGGCL